MEKRGIDQLRRSSEKHRSGMAKQRNATQWHGRASKAYAVAQHSLEKHGFEIYGRMPKLKGVIYGEIQSGG